MSETVSEFLEDYEKVTDELETKQAPAVETSEEYGYVEPSTDVPPPDDDVTDQNPGFVNGAHT
ncbi:MAG TPA: hypothetical protein PLM10_02060 [Saccharofermentans sp.]|nr:hypothetical protein [Saccharofermentans sp.]